MRDKGRDNPSAPSPANRRSMSSPQPAHALRSPLGGVFARDVRSRLVLLSALVVAIGLISLTLDPTGFVQPDAAVAQADGATGNGNAPSNGGAAPAPTPPTPPTPPAGDTGAANANANTGEGAIALPTAMELFMLSPIINGILAGLSALAFLMFFFFVFTVSTGAMTPASLVDDITKLVLNQQYDAAASLCRNNRHVFIASIIQRCVENAGKAHSVIMDMIDSEGRRRADIMWNRISYLADISNIAPMLGLLGTIIGMIKTFFLLPKQAGSINSQVLASGVGEAMATTMFGLIVGILALVFYSIVKARATKALAEAEQVVHSVADHIKRDSE